MANTAQGTNANSTVPLSLLSLLSTQKAAELLGLRPQTLRLWRMSGVGPPYIRLSTSRVAYSAQALADWMASRQFSSTSEETVKAGTTAAKHEVPANASTPR